LSRKTATASAQTRQNITNTLLDYIREHTSDGKWVPIKVKDAEGVLNSTNAPLICEILNSIKDLPQIEWSLMRPNGVGKAIRHYRYKDEQKVTVATNANGSITQDQLKIVMDKLASIKANISRNDRSRIMQVINLLRLFEADAKRLDNCITKITEFLPTSAQDAERYITALCNAGFVSVIDGSVMLYLNGDSPYTEPIMTLSQKKEEPKGEASARIQEVIDAAVKNAEDTPVAESVIYRPVEESQDHDTPVVVEISEPNSEDHDVMELLIKNLQEFSDYQKGFGNLLSGAIGNLTAGAQAGEVAGLKEELEKGAQAAESLMKENQGYVVQISDLKHEVKSLKKMIELSKKAEDEYHYHMQERFQIVLAEITNAVSDYNRIPEYKLIPTVKAQFQNTVIGAITSAIDDIINYTSPKVDQD
jgi:hypothetical protein